jgi:hypothetical protein
MISSLSMRSRYADVMPRLPLDDDQRHAFARRLNGVGVTQLVRGTRRRTPGATAMRRRSVRAAGLVQCGPRLAPGMMPKQRTDRKAAADLQPRLERVPFRRHPSPLRSRTPDTRCGRQAVMCVEAEVAPAFSAGRLRSATPWATGWATPSLSGRGPSVARLSSVYRVLAPGACRDRVRWGPGRLDERNDMRLLLYSRGGEVDSKRMNKPNGAARRYPKLRVKLRGEEGDAFAVLLLVAATLRRAGVPAAEITEFRKQATAGDHAHLMLTCSQWVNLR